VSLETEDDKESSFVNLTENMPITLDVKSKEVKISENEYVQRYTVR